MIKIRITLLTAAALLPALASGDTLELPAEARVEFRLVDPLILSEAMPGHDDVVMHPAEDGAGDHTLPEYCVVIGNARLDGDRIRLTANALTCIETAGSDSAIYSGTISAAAYDADGGYGVRACEAGRCELSPDQGFLLEFAEAIAIEQQANPSAERNEQRRQAQGEGIANPVPGAAPDPGGD